MVIVRQSTSTTARSTAGSVVLKAVHSTQSHGGEERRQTSVYLTSNLEFGLSLVEDGKTLEVDDGRSRSLSDWFCRVLQTNAESLNIANISGAYTDNDDPCSLKVSVSPRVNPYPAENSSASLLAIEIQLSFKGFSYSATQAFDASHIALFSTVLDRFLIYHLARRYPLIFGPWCKKVEQESAFFSSIVSSILRMTERTTNIPFQNQCLRIIKAIAKRSNKTVSPLESSATPPRHADSDAMCWALHKMLGFIRPRTIKLKRSLEDYVEVISTEVGVLPANVDSVVPGTDTVSGSDNTSHSSIPDDSKLGLSASRGIVDVLAHSVEQDLATPRGRSSFFYGFEGSFERDRGRSPMSTSSQDDLLPAPLEDDTEVFGIFSDDDEILSVCASPLTQVGIYFSDSEDEDSELVLDTTCSCSYTAPHLYHPSLDHSLEMLASTPSEGTDVALCIEDSEFRGPEFDWSLDEERVDLFEDLLDKEGKVNSTSQTVFLELDSDAE